MAQIDVQEISLYGLTPVFLPCNEEGDTFYNPIGRTFIYLKNGDTTDKTVTITSLKPCNQGYIHNVVVTVPANSEIMVGAFSPNRFNDTAQNVSITYSDVTNLTVAVIRLTY